MPPLDLKIELTSPYLYLALSSVLQEEHQGWRALYNKLAYNVTLARDRAKAVWKRKDQLKAQRSAGARGLMFIR